MNRGIYGYPKQADIALGSSGGEERLSKQYVTGRILLDPHVANCYDLTLLTNATFEFGKTMPNVLCSLFVIIRQDATGSRTLTWPAASILKWTGGSAATASTAASSIDAYSFFTVDGGVTWHGAQVGKGFA